MRDLFLVAKTPLTSKDLGVGNFFEHSQAVRPGNGLEAYWLALSRDLRSSDTAKFYAHCEDFLVRELICGESDFFTQQKDRLINRLGRRN